MRKRFDSQQVRSVDRLTLPWSFPGDSLYWVFWTGLFSVVMTAARRHLSFWGIASVVVFSAFCFYFFVFRKGYFRSWVIDFQQRMIYRQGSTTDRHLLNDDYSICLYSTMVSSGTFLGPSVEIWIVELTHRRKGPITRLCDFVDAQQEQAIDFAGALAQRLNLRTVGSGFTIKSAQKIG